MPNDKRKPFPYKQKLITCLATTVSCECNLLTYLLLRPLQVKIKNIYLFKILIKKTWNFFKSWLCPNFLLLPKKSELPKSWGGGCSPPRPPRPVRSWVYRPVGSCFAPFWSENGYTLCPLCSGIGYAFRGNYKSVWTYLSFQFQMIKIDSYGLFSWLCINIVRRKLVGTLSDVRGLMGLIERRRYLNTMKLYLKQRVWQAPFETRKLPCSKRRGMSGTLAFSGVGCSCVSYEESKCISEACLPLQCEDGFFL